MNKMHMKTLNRIRVCFFLTGLFSMLNLHVFAQSTPAESKVVRGKVTLKKDKSAQEHVSVTEVDSDGRIVKGTNTDIDGNYALKFSSLSNKISF